jgi:hypothetical protein
MKTYRLGSFEFDRRRQILKALQTSAVVPYYIPRHHTYLFPIVGGKPNFSQPRERTYPISNYLFL